MAEVRKSKRTRVQKQDSDFFVGEESDVVLCFATNDFYYGEKRHPAICILASRVRQGKGGAWTEQRPSPDGPQDLQQPNVEAGEVQEYFVLMKNPRAKPCWVKSEKVSLDLVKRFKHLLHIFPYITQLPIPGMNTVFMFVFACIFMVWRAFGGEGRRDHKRDRYDDIICLFVYLWVCVIICCSPMFTSNMVVQCSLVYISFPTLPSM